MNFFKSEPVFFGGALTQGRRKSARPLSAKRPLHLVLKCRRSISLRRHQSLIKNLSHKYSKQFGLKIYNESVQNDHYHLVLRIYHRKNYQNFIRALTSNLARRLEVRLWKLPPFTRILSWGRDFRATFKYVLQNENEILGLSVYKPRGATYSRFVLESNSNP